MAQAFLVDGVRTPVGRYGGALSSVRPDDLAATVLAGLLERTGIDPAAVDEVILGNANQSGEDNRNVARMALLLAGFPNTVPGITVNRLCASGMSAITLAAQMVEPYLRGPKEGPQPPATSRVNRGSPAGPDQPAAPLPNTQPRA